MENFQKSYICNHSDYEGRYRFDNQPFIAHWNLLVLAQILSPIASHEMMENYANQFIGKFKEKYFVIMAKKLGFTSIKEEDSSLILKLFVMLEECSIDYTPFFYYLSSENFDEVLNMTTQKDTCTVWLDAYKKRLELDEISAQQKQENMLKINPKYILKNYMLQEVIKEAQEGNYKLLNDVLEIAKNPYGEHKEYERYSKATPVEVGGYICSCSS
jgi:uncharacterized protein YdiU (UPF0061 family)